jgi:hypothetical protein
MAKPKPNEEKKLEEARNPSSISAIDYQCVLLERVHQLSAYHQQFLVNSPYKYVTQLGVGADGVSSVISRLSHGSRNDEVREIMDLCPDIHGLLSPYIKISRLDYTADGKPIPGSEQQLEIPNFLSPEDEQNILSGKAGRVPGAGIKSFKWELEGVQPEDVDNNITATLVVYFQSVGDFFAGAASLSDPGGYQAGKKKPTFLDLIINSPGSRGQGKKKDKGSSPSKKPTGCPDTGVTAGKIYEPRYFRIKVCAGWSTPPNLHLIYPELQKTRGAALGLDGKVAIPAAKKPRYQALQEALSATRVSLFLQQVRHDIDFKEDGSLTLTIQYQAALSGITREAGTNILVPGSNAEKIKGLREEKTDAEAEAKETEEDAETDDILEELADLEEADRKEKYAQLLQNIYKDGKVYKVQVNVDQLKTPDLSRLSDEERVKLATERNKQSHEMQAPVLATDGQSALLDALKEDKPSAEDSAEMAAKKSKEARKRAADGKGDDRAGWFTGSEDTVDIHYIYLGDLLDTVLGNLPGGKPSFDFFLSEIEMIDMLRAMRITDVKRLMACRDPAGSAFLQALDKVETKLTLSKLYKIMSIGDIPIALDSFQSYFIKSVVDKQRDKYYFLNFVKDVCSKLITNAMRSGCYGAGFKFTTRFDVHPVSFSKKPSPIKKLHGNPYTNITTLGKAIARLSCAEPDVSAYGAGMILFSTDAAGRGLVGDFNKDLKKGIYHHYIGASCGLMRKLDFQREDQPFLREAKIQKEGALGAAQLRELYSVNMTLVGSNLYKNGNYIYVSPLLINSTKEQMTLLGLHGYYLVTSVSSEITENSFTTSIRALQEGIEFRNDGPTGIPMQPIDTTPSIPPDVAAVLQEYIEYAALINNDLAGFDIGDVLLGPDGTLNSPNEQLNEFLAMFDTPEELAALGSSNSLLGALYNPDGTVNKNPFDFAHDTTTALATGAVRHALNTYTSAQDLLKTKEAIAVLNAVEGGVDRIQQDIADRYQRVKDNPIDTTIDVVTAVAIAPYKTAWNVGTTPLKIGKEIFDAGSLGKGISNWWHDDD